MALILKNLKQSQDPHTGELYTTMYGVVDFVRIEKQQKNAEVRVKIFVAKTHKNAGRQELKSHHLNRGYFAIGSDYDTYFSISKMTPAGKNIYKQAYLWLLTVMDDDGNLIFEDWESDE